MSHHYEIEKARCKGCGLCIHVCPKGVLKLNETVNSSGYFLVYQDRAEDCIYCSLCATMCPEVAITIKEQEIVKD